MLAFLARDEDEWVIAVLTLVWFQREERVSGCVEIAFLTFIVWTVNLLIKLGILAFL